MEKPNEAGSGRPQYPVQALLAVTAVAAVLSAVARLAGAHREQLGLARHSAGFLPAEWCLAAEGVVLAVMLAGAGPNRRLRALVPTGGSAIFLGGVLAFTSGLFVYDQGPGGGSSLYGDLTSYASLSGLPLLLGAWPMPYGAVVACMSYLEILGSRRPSYHSRWAMTSLFLGVVCSGGVIVALWPGVWWPDGSTRAMYFGIHCAVLVVLLIVAGLARDGPRKIKLTHLVASVWLLAGLYPRVTVSGQRVSLSEVLGAMGPGFWLLMLGNTLILVGTLLALVRRFRLPHNEATEGR